MYTNLGVEIMKVRQDAWTDENDLLLAETVLRHVREGSTQLNAFEEVGDKLDRTSAACGFRWNAVVRHQYEKALQLAKKQRKQRQRILGKDQGGKKKLLYSPPAPTVNDVEAAIDLSRPIEEKENSLNDMNMTETMISTVNTQQASYPVASELNIEHVISYLQTLKHSSIQLDILRNENERLKRENAQIKSHNDELQGKINHLEQNSVSIQEDYETLMKIMNRARKLVLFEEEEKPTTKFKMDRNGNLEKMAE